MYKKGNTFFKESHYGSHRLKWKYFKPHTKKKGKEEENKIAISIINVCLKHYLPNVVERTPPITGSGIVEKKAPNLPKTPTIIRMHAATWITSLLPT